MERERFSRTVCEVRTECKPTTFRLQRPLQSSQPHLGRNRRHLHPLRHRLPFLPLNDRNTIPARLPGHNVLDQRFPAQELFARGPGPATEGFRAAEAGEFRNVFRDALFEKWEKGQLG